MLSFHVADMTCGRCAGAITRAVAAVDAAATVQVDLSERLVRVDAPASRAGTIAAAIEQAGYRPEPVEPGPAPAARSGAGACCCGASPRRP